MQPIIFEPWLRPMIWGGRRLGEALGKALPPEGVFGESWEISAHRLHVSRVADGPTAGKLLTEIAPGFPLLIKYLDCRDRLSVQVHPDNSLAGPLCGETFGKSEAWVVLEASETAGIWAGLKPGVTRRDLESALTANQVTDCLHSFSPRPGQVLYLPAGTVHAVGGGVLLAEVQQSSDATLRLWDWGRDRPLHLPQALDAIDWSRGPVEPCAGMVCDLFSVILVRGEMSENRPAGWLVLEGEATIAGRRLRRGDTALTLDPCEVSVEGGAVAKVTWGEPT